jgi:hypothetical protein
MMDNARTANTTRDNKRRLNTILLLFRYALCM